MRHSRFLGACRGEPVDCTPVWFMRQAGRSLPEYRRARGVESILEAVRDPELAAELTLQPLRRYEVDAAILFSDIMVPLTASGFDVAIRPGIGPVVDPPFRRESDLGRLRPIDPPTDIPWVFDAVRIVCENTDLPVIGFAGGPFTLASYLVEGGPSRSHTTTRALMHSEPRLWEQLVTALAEMSLAVLRAQVKAGCSAVQVFDSWVGVLSPTDYERFVLPASRRIFEGLTDLGIPTIHFGVGTGELLALMADAGADVVGVDWRVTIDTARERIGDRKSVQGNLDPAVCLAPWPEVERAARDVIRRNAGRPGHIFNLGHGVLPETQPETLERLARFVHEETAA
ncbi:MAG: uroporphyrinogen decarboxylase [Acidimicrobiales bacterium]|nr:MAG: uroporphyrinogen decarboxylase [Acidimicrobiales bacterium]